MILYRKIFIIGLVYFLYFLPIGATENRNIPWFIYRNAVYYIDKKAIYTSKEARALCMQKNMMFTISLQDTKNIVDYVAEIYGFIPSLWTFDNEKYGILLDSSKTSQQLDDTCYKLNQHDASFSKANCSEKMGFLCKRPYVGSTIYFINGARQDIDKNDVEIYCNPHSTKYDKVIQLCLVRYFKLNAKTMNV
ncbi:uncharacterized protein LOC142239285 [Haematobia irritans]|uniref:uncharacterized protein LOC142239285 n=1 Tax=Haematobia irritans TaxID=7368 RepID=UPI003F4FBF58